MKNARYDYAKLNKGWIVVDRRSSQLVALTDKGAWADVGNPAHVRFFNLSRSEAKQIADKLNNG